ncbi:MAG: S41 family peptidase [bacterium]|nr:S41 family peptidase [bacterium]
MMRKLSLTLLSLALVLHTLSFPTVFAQEADESDTEVDLNLKTTTEFLNKYQFIGESKGCIRKQTDDTTRKATTEEAICVLERIVKEKSETVPIQAYKKAIQEGLLAKDARRLGSLKKIDFLVMALKAAGIQKPFFSTQEDWEEEVKSIKNPEHQSAITAAIKTRIFPTPQGRAGVRRLIRDLTQEELNRSEMLGIAYSITSNAHVIGEQKELIIEFVPEGGRNNLGGKGSYGETLNEVLNTLKARSYFNKDFKADEAAEKAIKAMVKSLEKDKYIQYYTPSEYQAFFSGLQGKFFGIGAYIEEKESQIIIVSPIKGSPAETAGLHAGDIVLKIDGRSTEGMTLQEAVTLIRGPKGEKLTLTVKRNGSQLAIDIIRDEINIPTLEVVDRSDGVKVMKLVQFGANTALQMRKELEKIKASPPAGLVIDLRNNPGGFLNVVVEILDALVDKDKDLVLTKDLHSTTPFKSSRDAIIDISVIPTTIIVNRGSASASEILAGTLQDYGIKVLGEKSFGKGTVQEIAQVGSGAKGGGALKFTVAEWLTAKGRSIDNVGVTPDILIMDDPATTEVDEAIERAVLEMNHAHRGSTRFNSNKTRQE